MSNFGIGKVRYKPICSSEEMELEIKIPSANEVVKNMWNKLDDTEKGFINIMIDKNNKQDLEIERLNNIINELNYGIKELDNMFYETFRISQNGYYSISEWELKEFTDKLQELKGSDK